MIKRIVLFAFFLLPFTALLAQGGEVEVDVTSFFNTFASLVAGVILVTEALKRALDTYKHTPDILIQIMSWLVGILLTMFGWLMNLGFLSSMLWYQALLYGFGASLAANGVADTKLVQKIIDIIISLFRKKR